MKDTHSPFALILWGGLERLHAEWVHTWVRGGGGVQTYGTGVTVRDGVPAPPLTSCRELGKLCHFSVPPFFSIQKAELIAR